MNVLIHSYFPPLADHLLGGAQTLLNGLLTAFGALSIRTTVVCPPAGGRPLIPKSPRLTVIDQLQSVENENTSPRELQHDLRLLARLEEGTDVIITVDTHYPLRTMRPVVLCLNNFSYAPETRSVYGLNWDAIVVPSEYGRRCIQWYFGPSAWSGDPRPVYVVPCGLDTSTGREGTSVAELCSTLGLSPSGRYLAFPHRPDPRKGFETAVRATATLRRLGLEYTLLVPEPPASEVYPHQRAYMKGRRTYVEAHGAADAAIFHPWICAKHMTAYFQAAEWTLCPSTLPETFGLSVAQSISAGTPVLATLAGAVSELLPVDHGVVYIEFGDHSAIVETIRNGGLGEALLRGRRYVAERFTWAKCSQEWIRILATVRKNNSSFIPSAPADGDNAPWVHVLPSGRVWHDYVGRHIDRTADNCPNAGRQDPQGEQRTRW